MWKKIMSMLLCYPMQSQGGMLVLNNMILRSTYLDLPLLPPCLGDRRLTPPRSRCRDRDLDDLRLERDLDLLRDLEVDLWRVVL